MAVHWTIDDLIRPRGGYLGTAIDGIYLKPPHTKEVNIGYGIFSITYFNAFGKDPDWKDPTTASGRATWATALQLTSRLLHALGLVPGAGTAISGAGSLLLSDAIIDSIVSDDAERIANLGLDLEPLREALSTSGGQVSALHHAADYLRKKHNWDGITRILWRTAPSGVSNGRVAMGQLAKLLPAVGSALTAFGILNESLPFLYDLRNAPGPFVYDIRHRPQVRDRPPVLMEVEIDQLQHPVASVTRRVDDMGLQLDASMSTDEYDTDVQDLRFRWDFNEDGEWDGPWRASPETEANEVECDREPRRDDPEPYRVEMEVRDLDGLVGTATYSIGSEPPQARFSVSTHENPDGTLLVSVDASSSSDNCTATKDLRFAWDFDSSFDVDNGDLDTPFGNRISDSHLYDRVGEHWIHLWVKDLAGHTGYDRRSALCLPSMLGGLDWRLNNREGDVEDWTWTLLWDPPSHRGCSSIVGYRIEASRAIVPAVIIRGPGGIIGTWEEVCPGIPEDSWGVLADTATPITSYFLGNDHTPKEMRDEGNWCYSHYRVSARNEHGIGPPSSPVGHAIWSE